MQKKGLLTFNLFVFSMLKKDSGFLFQRSISSKRQADLAMPIIIQEKKNSTSPFNNHAFVLCERRSCFTVIKFLSISLLFF